MRLAMHGGGWMRDAVLLPGRFQSLLIANPAYEIAPSSEAPESNDIGPLVAEGNP